jgi:hypothetical protein
MPVASGMQLRPGDGLRTLDHSSAGVQFERGGQLLMGESTSITVSSAGSVVLTSGEADVRMPREALPLEIGVGEAKLSPLTSTEPASGRVRSRGAVRQVMAFAGVLQLSLPGRAPIDVPGGTGITLGAGDAASIPEKLLAAPRPTTPVAGSAPDHANPRFWWEDVPGAASYRIDVCRDEACAEIVEQGVAVSGAPWTPAGLPLGQLYWRVFAVAESGLDSPPSRPLGFTIRSLWRQPYLQPSH